MRSRLNCKFSFVAKNRRLAAALATCFAVAIASSCSQRGDPEAAFRHARETFRHGNTAEAEIEAQRGYERFHHLSLDWRWKFKLLTATVLSWRGMQTEVLALIDSDPEPPTDPDLIVRKHRLEGAALLSQLNFEMAERDFRAAESTCAAYHPPACSDLPSAWGWFEMRRGNYAAAQRQFAEALGLDRKSGDHFLEATALLNLSWCTEEQTHFDEALTWADAARGISQSNGYSDITETALGNMGWAYYRLGDWERAEELFLEAEKESETLADGIDESRWLQTLGYLYLDNGKPDAAQTSFQQSLAKAEQVRSREHIINSLIALAFVSEQTGKIDDATRFASEALSMARADGNKRDETYPRLVQGRIAARSHDFASAETAFNEVASSNDSPVFLKWEAERSLAQLYEAENLVGRADAEYRTALSTFEAARSELQHENSRLPFLNNATRIYDDYIHLLVSQGKMEQALQVADYSRARTLSEGLGVLKGTNRFQPDPVNAREVARRVATLPSRTKREKDGATAAIFFYWLGEKQSYLWAITSSKIQLFSLPPAAEIDALVQRYRRALLGPEDPVELLNADGLGLYRALVEPAAGVLGSNPRVFIIPDGSLNTVNFETLLVDGAKPHYWIEDVTIANASSLRLLGGPQRSTAAKEFERQQQTSAAKGVSSDHPVTARLEAAPFQTPTLAGRGSYAYGSRRLQRISSPHKPGRTTGPLQFAALAGEEMPPPLHEQLLLIGNAVAANADYPELRKASSEMESIEKHFGSAQERVFAREAATPAAYLDSQPEEFSYIHFVAHGTASRMNPLDSAIVLSANGTQEDSFKLYAREIIQHPLRAELVTISTCYGAGSRAYSGEGLVGLSWAFLRAGAHHVIGALWEVSDVSTPQLMDDLYGELQRGRSADAALRAAKLKLLHSGTSFRRPFYWAPFQLYTGS